MFETGPPPGWRYSAFISYSRHDANVVRWLHRALENFKIPKALIGTASPIGIISKRLPPLFRDRDELSSAPDLASALEHALAGSSALIVVCSPDAARSRWVNEEVRRFIELGRSDRIFTLIVGGEPGASRRPGIDASLEAFPAALLEQGREPLASDIREGGDGRRNAALKLIAGLLAVDYDRLKQRDLVHRHRLLTIYLALTAGALGVMTALAIYALVAREEAVRQRDIARQRTLTADRTSNFVKSLFEISDPSEARGQSITARAVLDRGVNSVNHSLAAEPTVRLDMLTTLAEVYANLGLLNESWSLIDDSRKIANPDSKVSARRFAVAGDIASRRGQYKPALALYARAQSLDIEQEYQGRLFTGIGEAQSALGNFAAAQGAIYKALQYDRRAHGERSVEVARDLEALGLNAFLSRHMAIARSATQRAVAIRTALEGEDHPRVMDDLNMLGSVAYETHDTATAEYYYRRVLAVGIRILGPTHPDIAMTLNNLARVLIERRQFAEAEPLLKRSVKITLREHDSNDDDLPWILSNYGNVLENTGRRHESEAYYRKALDVAESTRHRSIPLIKIDLADVLCVTGHRSDALILMNDAKIDLEKFYPNEAWRQAWLDNGIAYCKLRAQKNPYLIDELRSSARDVAKRWPPGSLYRGIVDQRLESMHLSKR